MKLDLSEIAHSLGMHYTYEVDYQPDMLESGLKLLAPVKGSIEFANAGQLVIARGKLQTSVELECARCLTPHAWDVTIELDEQYPAVLDAGDPNPEQIEQMHRLQEELEIPEEVYLDFILDLSELIRQDLLVELPFASVCSEDCKGLCTRCGKNLNEGPCQCPPEEVLGPLAKLKDILGDSQTADA